MLVLIASVSLLCGKAQTNPPTFIKGTMGITFNTHQNPPNTKGVQDDYDININVANSALFHGKMTDRPQIIDGWISKAVTQPRLLSYDVACDVVNPRNPAQTKNIGKMYGSVPISSDGVYHYDQGSLEVDILPMGNAGGFTSKFGGTALGHVLARPSNWMDTLQAETVNITRSINGKTSTVQLKKYDKMNFSQTTIAAGPTQRYQQVIMNGDMLYDYEKQCWFFNNMTAQYTDEHGMVKIDRIAGTIRWVEDPARKSNGLGQYEFDVRVNEPPPSQDAAFAAPTDDSAFFETDSSIPGLTGTMKYKDTLNSNGDTLSSQVAIDLAGNNISKEQTMVLAKVIIFASVIPMNSD